MRIIKTKNYEQMSIQTANIISSIITLNNSSVLGLATGSTPIGTYEELASRCSKGSLDFSQVKTVNLDEYVGLSNKNENSYHYFMEEHFFSKVNIQRENINILDGEATDSSAECLRFDKVLSEIGRLDLQLLGIGHNGHIGFNEPSSEFTKNTHSIELSQRTIEANSRLFDHISEVPHFAYTMGIQSIMNSKCILLIASGQDKADIMYESLFGPITPQVPASVLQLHKNLIVIVDEEASARV